jgi:VWFA-related protein
MWRRATESLAVVCLLGAGIDAPRQAPPSFRGVANAVPLYVTVTDAEGRAVSGLTRDEFEILEDGRARDVAVFAAAHQPVAATLLLDMNGPPVEVPWLRDAATAFVNALAPDDRVRLGTFGDEIFLSPRLTGDRAYLHWLLREELWAAASSPLWNAVDAALAADGEPADRRTIVLLTNGYHAPPRRLDGRVGARDVLDRAEATGTAVFVVTFEAVTLDRRLQLLADRTGGRLTTIQDLSFAPEVFAGIVSDLHTQYMLGFVPARIDGDTHEIEVRVTRPGATVRSRTRYRTVRTP